MTHAQFKVGDEVIVLFFNAHDDRLSCSRGILNRIINGSRYHVVENGTGKAIFCDPTDVLSGDASKEEVIKKAKEFLEKLILEPMVEGPLERIFS